MKTEEEIMRKILELRGERDAAIEVGEWQAAIIAEAKIEVLQWVIGGSSETLPGKKFGTV